MFLEVVQLALDGVLQQDLGITLLDPREEPAEKPADGSENLPIAPPTLGSDSKYAAD
jgi:hypothetical protein